MSDVFLDTVGLIAVWDNTDQWHEAANAAYRRLLAQGRRLVTINLVLCECGNESAFFLARLIGRSSASGPCSAWVRGRLRGLRDTINMAET